MVNGKNEELAVNYLFENVSGFGTAEVVVEKSGGGGIGIAQLTAEEQEVIQRVMFCIVNYIPYICTFIVCCCCCGC